MGVNELYQNENTFSVSQYQNALGIAVEFATFATVVKKNAPS